MFIPVGGRLAATIGLTLALCAGDAQQAFAQESEPGVLESAEAVDITGGKSAVVLQKELSKIEAGFFAAFNEVNTNKDFHVKCSKVKVLGSRRRVQVCQPRFASRYEAEANKDIATNRGQQFQGNQGSEIWQRMKKQEKLFWEEISSLVIAYPALQEKFTELTRAKRALAAASQ